MNVVGLSLLVVIVVALFICIITLATGLAYMHRSLTFAMQWHNYKVAPPPAKSSKYVIGLLLSYRTSRKSKFNCIES